MKRYLFATAAVLMLPVASASAADMSYPVKAPPVIVAPAFSWTGFYLGVHGGYGGNKFEYPYDAYVAGYADPESLETPPQDARLAPPPVAVPEDYVQVFNIDLAGKADVTSSGFFGGGQVGYNYQFSNNFVLGAEADIAWSGIKGEVNINGVLSGGYYDPDLEEYLEGVIGSAGISLGSEVEWFGTVRARAGYAWDRVLLYATGGLAYGKVKSHATLNVYDGDGDNIFGGTLSKSDTQWGWTIGGGLEYAITDNWTFKTEYLYVDLGNQTLFADAVEGDVTDNLYLAAGAGIEVDTKFHTLKAGLNYKF